MREVDTRLPGGGLIKNALHEVRPFDPQDGPAATAFMLGLAKRLSADSQGSVVWIRPQELVREWGVPYAPGVSGFGISPARFLFIHPRNEQEALWATEEALKARGVALVMAEVEGAKLDLTASRRIHLAAEDLGTPALITRGARWRGGTSALTRWAVRAAPSEAPAYSKGRIGVGAPRWKVDLERVKGGRPGSFWVEWDYETHSFSLAAPLVDRSAAASLRGANENIAAA